jgi:hypothetical protein
VIAAAALAAGTACARNVPQDRATGEDGKARAAVPIVMQPAPTQASRGKTAGKARGIVTYPGGDRIDWKRIELPAKTRGTLSLKLSWTPPRPGLAVALDVFDQYGREVDLHQRRRRGRVRTQRAQIENATGAYLVRIYAPTRGDAGAYRLAVEYDPVDLDAAGFPTPGTAIPEPPDLPAPQPQPVTCDDLNYKQHPAACRAFCPSMIDPSWPGCAGKCDLRNPSADIVDCRDKMECPTPADKRVKKCKASDIPECPAGAPVTNLCRAPGPLPPVLGEVQNASVKGSKVEVTINRGSAKGVQRGWTMRLLDARGKPTGKTYEVTKTAERQCWVTVDLTTDQVADKRVQLTAP